MIASRKGFDACVNVILGSNPADLDVTRFRIVTSELVETANMVRVPRTMQRDFTALSFLSPPAG